MRTRKNIFLWALYDFANSIVAVVFFLYFAQWIVVDRGVSDFRFNLTFTVSAILLLLTAPILGSLLDRTLRRISGLRWSTLLTVFFYGLCAISALQNHNVFALIFFTLGMYFYLLSFTFYTPLLNAVSGPENRGFISGIGITANYLGQFAGLALVLPMSNGSFSFFGASPRAETLLPSVVAFFILALPTLLFFSEPKKTATGQVRIASEIAQTLKETMLLFSNTAVRFFLISYFLFNDAILTAINNFPIFLEQVWKISDKTKTYLMFAILITCAVGGALGGLVADKAGHKRTLFVILSGWVVLLPLVGLITHFNIFTVSAVLMGFWYGATWAVSRSVMSYVAPLSQNNLAFSYFGLAERASSFVGPLVWGFTVSQLLAIGSERYRIAMLVISAFVIFGVWMLYHVRDDRVLQTRSETL